MAQYKFGFGEYKYGNYPLPIFVKNLRMDIYPHLVKVANLDEGAKYRGVT